MLRQEDVRFTGYHREALFRKQETVAGEMTQKVNDAMGQGQVACFCKHNAPMRGWEVETRDSPDACGLASSEFKAQVPKTKSLPQAR